MPEEKTATTKRTVKKVAAAIKSAPAPAEAKPKKASSAKPVAAAPATKAASKVATAAPTKGETVKKKSATTQSKSTSAAKATAAKSTKPTRKATATTGKPPAAMPSHETRLHWIATAAYHRAEIRGFLPGHEMQDWLDAEAEISAQLGEI